MRTALRLTGWTVVAILSLLLFATLLPFIVAAGIWAGLRA